VDLGVLGKSQAALETEVPSPAKRKGVPALPSSSVTLGDEQPARELFASRVSSGESKQGPDGDLGRARHQSRSLQVFGHH